MKYIIRPLSEPDIKAVIQFSLLAWEPVFESFRAILGSRIFTLLYPEWRSSQSRAVESVIRNTDKFTTWVAEVSGQVVGFIAYSIDQDEKTGEVEMLAVHPEYQNEGIGTALNEYVLDRMREHGVLLATVGTGGDPGHAPARRSYEKAGYTGIPLVRYYQDLSGIPASGVKKDAE